MSGAPTGRQTTAAALPAPTHLGGVEFATISSLEEFGPLAADWDRLVAAMPRPSPFLTHAWIEEWWRVFGRRSRLVIAVARRDGATVAAVPLMVTRRLGVRIAEFVGSRHSALADVLVAPGTEPWVVDETVRRAFGGGYDVANLTGLTGESRLVETLAGRLRVVLRVEAPVLDLSAGWDSVYRAKTSSRKRNLHKRRRRQLAELGRLETSVVRDPDGLERALEDAFRLHDLRWSGRPDRSEFTTPLGLVFQRRAIGRLARQGSPRIVMLTLDGRPVAFHYFFAFCGRMYVYGLAFDPALGRFSPGLVNTLDAIQAAAEEGLTMVEFLGGDERYKMELADRVQPLYQGIGMARTPAGAVYAGGIVAAIAARRRLKRQPLVRRVYFEAVAPVRRVAVGFGRRVASRRAAV